MERGAPRTTQAASISTTRCILELSPGSHRSKKRLFLAAALSLSSPHNLHNTTQRLSFSKYFTSNYTNCGDNFGDDSINTGRGRTCASEVNLQLIGANVFTPCSHFLQLSRKFSATHQQIARKQRRYDLRRITRPDVSPR